MMRKRKQLNRRHGLPANPPRAPRQEIALALLLCGCTLKPPRPPGAAPTLQQTVSYLAAPALDGRDEGSEGSRLARAFLIRELERCGVLPAGSSDYTQPIESGRGTNILGRVAGTLSDAQGKVLLSAHYDHQGGGWRTHPGAYDNATSVAAVLQIACSLAKNPPVHDVVIAFWDSEEPPAFLHDEMGSAWWAEHPTVEDVRTVLVLDLMGSGLWNGYQGTFTFGLESSEELRQLHPSIPVPAGLQPHVASLSLVEDLVTGQKATWSDYDAFRDRNIPHLFFTDGQNKRYHTPQDTAEAVDYAKLALEAQWVESWTRAVADQPSLPTWSPAWSPPRNRASVDKVLRDFIADNPFGDKVTDAVRIGLDDPNTHRAAQRLMCYAGADTPAFLCGML